MYICRICTPWLKISLYYACLVQCVDFVCVHVYISTGWFIVDVNCIYNKHWAVDPALFVHTWSVEHFYEGCFVFITCKSVFTYKDTSLQIMYNIISFSTIPCCQARCRDGAKVNHTHSHKFAQLNQNALNDTIENMKQLRNCLENVRMGGGGREGGVWCHGVGCNM